MSAHALQRGSVAIVGAAESDLGEVAAGMSVTDLMSQAVQRALDDCGLSLADVDGVFAAAGQSRMPTTALCEYLNIHPRYHDGTFMGGSSFMTLVAPRTGCHRGRAVRGCRHRLRQHAAQRRAQERRAARIQPV